MYSYIDPDSRMERYRRFVGYGSDNPHRGSTIVRSSSNRSPALQQGLLQQRIRFPTITPMSNVHGSRSSPPRQDEINYSTLKFVTWPFHKLDVATDGMIHEHALYRLYRGHETTGRPKKEVLIKLLKAHTESNILELLQLELRAALLIRHPNILEVIGWSHAPENNFSVVHESMLRGTLYSNLHPFGRLPWDVRYRVSCDLASVILHLHEKKILHRNIASDVVLLDPDYTAKLTSFVLAKFGRFGRGKSELIQIPEQIRKPEYIRGGVVTPAFDVHSFGIVLLEIATGMDAPTILEKLGNSSEWHEIKEAADQRLNGDQMERVLLAGLCCSLPTTSSESRPPLEEIVGYLTDGHGHEKISSFIEAHHSVTSSSPAEEQQANIPESQSVIEQPLLDFGLVPMTETFDIGIPENYCINGSPLQNHHCLMIRGFLDYLQKEISGKVRFESIREIIKSCTSSLVASNAPLEDWNSSAQLVLRRTKQIEYLWARYNEEHQRLVLEALSQVHGLIEEDNLASSTTLKSIKKAIEDCKAEIGEYKSKLNRNGIARVADCIEVSTAGTMLN